MNETDKAIDAEINNATANAGAKLRKPKAVIPYVVGVWADGKFVPCDDQPEAQITEFAEIVRWTIARFGAHPDQYSFVRKDPRTLKIEEQKTIKGTLV